MAYELLNEPVPPSPDDWNVLMNRTIMELRILEPERMLILDPSSHSSIGQLRNMDIPKKRPEFYGDSSFLYSTFTNSLSGKLMDGLKNLTIQLHYPGQLVAQEDVDTITIQRHKEVVNYYNGYYDKSCVAIAHTGSH